MSALRPRSSSHEAMKKTRLVLGAVGLMGAMACSFVAPALAQRPVIPTPPPPNAAGSLTGARITSDRQMVRGRPTEHYPSGQQLTMNLMGTGTCEMSVELHTKRGAATALLYRRTLRQRLPFEYVSDFDLPTMGRRGETSDSVVRVVPHARTRSGSPCAGPAITREISVIAVGGAGPRQKPTPLALNLGVLRPHIVLPRLPQEPPPQGAVTGVTAAVDTDLLPRGPHLGGRGACEVDLRIVRDGGGYDETIEVTPRALPVSLVQGRDLEGLPPGRYVATATAESPCTGTGTARFEVAAPTTPSNNGNNNAPPNAQPGAPPVPPPPPVPVPLPGKPANGAIASMMVPGGSFAEDETQKIKVMGSGGCAFDLRISNTSYGGSFDKTYPVNPLNLTPGSMLYNGTHFATLAEGSYSATATGTGGCTGKASIDFKVTGKSLQGEVKGQPTLTLDKKPQSGDTFVKSKDSNIWFKVAVPSSFKDTPYVSCCEVELNYKNAYGGWEVLPTSPFTDAGMNPMANNNSAVPKSVSYFGVPNEVATEWRMRVRGYRYKYAFEWSDWLEFKVDQK
jgi:hypothetical protein